MDQVKVYLGVAKKHHFWILSAIVVITAITVWWTASSSLATKYDTDKKTILGAESSVQKANALGPDGYLPNQSFATKVDELHDGLKKQVFDAWEKLYQRQAELFKWPSLEEMGPSAIDLNKLRPDEEIPQFARIFYNEQMAREEWQALLDQAQIRKPKVNSETDDEAEADDTEKRGIEYEGLVVWKPELRDAIVARYYTENGVPSTTRLRLNQEDVWLFESLIEVVNTVNAGATDSLKAPIKEIDSLDVAQWAVAASLESGSPIWTPGAKTGGGGQSGPMGGAGPPMGGAGGPPMGGAGPPMGGAGPPSPSGPAGGGGSGPSAAPSAGATSAAGTDADNEWLDGRYLDEKGQPLKAGSPQPYAEFRQVFVYMKLIMDQRRISDLIAACANAQLPIETRQVKVQMLKGDSAAASGGGLFPMGGSGGMQSGGMGGMPSGPMSSGSMGPEMSPGMSSGGPPMGGGLGGVGFGGAGAGGQEGGVETTVYDAVVELSGVIYLYNPPDIAKLGAGAAGSPEKRSFGVPTTSVRAPGGSAAGRSSYSPMSSGQ
jgi:hypothetical protein